MPTRVEREPAIQQQPKIRLRRSKGCAPWGVTPKAARGGVIDS
ncbi:hypothetical protein J2W49_000442 [Hydrogenophaga palleronii]|uniref:Uncharacterized protein n=1 Tax=Hydrogenophaga palleronii TaxID=65655 RepID=A0ABU1WGY5_9BURK|nr:hypothetical protein [Hydrogenophaga palleronii]